MRARCVRTGGAQGLVLLHRLIASVIEMVSPSMRTSNTDNNRHKRMCGLDRTTVRSSANVHHDNNVSTGMYRYNERQSQYLRTIHLTTTTKYFARFYSCMVVRLVNTKTMCYIEMIALLKFIVKSKATEQFLAIIGVYFNELVHFCVNRLFRNKNRESLECKQIIKSFTEQKRIIMCARTIYWEIENLHNIYKTATIYSNL